MDQHLQIEIRNGTGPVVVSLTGDIDLATEGQVTGALTGLAGREVIVDLSRVGFIDSSGIRALVVGNKASEEAGGTLALRAPSANTARVLEVTGVSTYIKIVE